MSVRLKSRTQCPPNGFLYTQRETGWKSEVAVPSSQWDFDLLCKSLQAHRMSNVPLAIKFKWHTDLNTIKEEVDQVNAIRVLTMPGAQSYVIAGGNAPPKTPAPSTTGPVSAVAGRVRKLISGAGTLLDWLGSRGQPVSPTLAAQRADICIKCPKNDKSELTAIFTEPASALIRKQIAQRDDLNLTLPQDGQLGVCSACLCPMKLKVFVDLPFILAHTSDAVRTELDPGCWILLEK
jgi:hypothetical protein